MFILLEQEGAMDGFENFYWLNLSRIEPVCLFLKEKPWWFIYLFSLAATSGKDALQSTPDYSSLIWVTPNEREMNFTGKYGSELT
jgi:hypothetical protein